MDEFNDAFSKEMCDGCGTYITNCWCSEDKDELETDYLDGDFEYEEEY